jgi:hypothetical protein
VAGAGRPGVFWTSSLSPLISVPGNAGRRTMRVDRRGVDSPMVDTTKV